MSRGEKKRYPSRVQNVKASIGALVSLDIAGQMKQLRLAVSQPHTPA
jgi:hypothetical protein